MSRFLMTMLSPLNYGATRMGALYALELKRRGHEVLVVYARAVSGADEARSCLEMLTSARIAVQHSPGILKIQPILRRNSLFSIARAWKPDAFISNQLRDAPSTIRVSHRLRVPGIVFALNAPRFSGHRSVQPFKRWMYGRTVRALASHVVCCAEGVAAELRSRYRVPEQRLTIANNGIDLTALPCVENNVRNQIRTELGLRDELLLVNLARIEEQKGHQYLVHAAKILRDDPSVPPFRIIVAGGAESTRSQSMLRELNEFIDQHQLHSQMQFLGYRADGWNLLNASDGFVLSSLWEGLPLAVLEAFAAKRPVVMADYGDRFRGFRDGIDGIYTNSRDAASLASGLKTLLKMSAEDRAKMGHNGRAFVEANLTLQRGAAIFCDTVERIAAQHPSKAMAH